jgi:tetratricopeptide repeat protein
MAGNIRKEIATLLLLLLNTCMPVAAQKSKDAEELGKALEYFASAKYHEALLIFQHLNRTYRLNDRFKAYIGLCYYHEWDYDNAARYLEEAIPGLNTFAPHERSVYYYTAAESFFNMRRYGKAVPYYEMTLPLCYEREKGDVCYRLGLCFMFMQEWKKAYDQYMNAERLYQQYKKEKEVQGRLAQIVRMAAACRTEYEAVSPQDSLQKKTYNTTEGDNATTQLKSISTIIKSLTSTMLSKPVIPVLVKDIISKKEKTNLQK